MVHVLSNDFKRQWEDCGAEVLAAVQEVGESGWYILGNEVQAFEINLSKVFNLPHAIGCANGMDGLELALRALDIEKGAKVVTTPLSAFATTLAILRAGLTPVFIDVDESGLIDLDECEAAIKADSSIKCMMPVHLYGHCLDLGRIEKIKLDYGICVVEDCAQSILASFRGRFSGTVGDLAATSFYPTKNLGALGDGGAVLTRDSQLAEKVRVLRDYGQTSKYVHDVLGLNSRLDELHAAILNRVFLPRLNEWTARRTKIAEMYNQGLDSQWVRPLPAPTDSKSCWHLFPVLVGDGDRSQFQSHLKETGISSAIHYPSLIPSQRALADFDATTRFSKFEKAENIARTVVSLPNHPYMTDKEVAYCIESVNKWTPR